MTKFFHATLLLILFSSVNAQAEKADQRIFIFGSDIEPKFVEYVKELVSKTEPRICYLPTASADNADNIKYWNFICEGLEIEPHVLKVWIDSGSQDRSFEELLLDMDAIIVGGGNTLNMLGIWKYQGIDEILKKALAKGVIVGGGSAGSICWFRNGISDARPVSLSVVEGLGLLPFSHCPHYNDSARCEMYNRLVAQGAVRSGYACDDHAGVLFVNGRVADVVASDSQARVSYVSRRRGELNVTRLTPRILLRKGALDTSAYRKVPVCKTLREFPDRPPSMLTPLSSFVTVQRLFAEGRYSEYHQYAAKAILEKVGTMQDRQVDAFERDRKMSVEIIAYYVYDDVAAILSKGSAVFYSLWYFSCEDGNWKCLGEDIGGYSPADAEITFREKAPVLVKK